MLRRSLPLLLFAGLQVAGSAAPAANTTLAVAGRANANVSLAASGSFVAAVWSASASSGDTDIYAAISRDGARSFSAPIRVNSTPGEARVNAEQPPRVALKSRSGAAPDVAVIWTAKGALGTTLLSATSRDGGRTFGPSAVVPGSDAAGARGWEAIGLGPGGRFFSVWLDHRKMAQPDQPPKPSTGGQHHHETGVSPSKPITAPEQSVAMAQLSQLYVGALDGSLPPQSITAGVCYCCKTAIAAGRSNELFLTWRHVFPGSMRDMAFAASRDGGRTYSAPVRVSEDKWQLEGCPDDGPSMAVDPAGNVHIVWPTVVTEQGGPVKTLFHAMSRDGRTFTPRRRLPTAGVANHPQLGIDARGTLSVVWDESGTGTRVIASAVGRLDPAGQVSFTRSSGSQEVGSYPMVAALQPAGWVRAWTSGPPDRSEIRLTIGE